MPGTALCRSMNIYELQSNDFAVTRLEDSSGLAPVLVEFDPDHGGATSEKIAAMVGEIKGAAYDVGLVVLRNVVPFSREDFRDLGAEFGELEDLRQINEVVDAPEGDPAWYLEEMRRTADNTGERPGIQRGVHQDRAYVDPPSDISMLRILRSSTVGGNTNFVDMRSVFDILTEPGELGDQIIDATGGAASIETLEVGHSYSDATLENRGSENTGEATLPLVLEHPVTGRKAIFYSEANALRVYGVGRRLGNALASRIVGLCNGEFSIKGGLVPRYSHRWETPQGYGDIAIWDNRVVGHASTSSTGERYGERLTVRDDPPTNWHRLSNGLVVQDS
jgi:alpha-ketoglutarate-dependent taurine dioxygenase